MQVGHSCPRQHLQIGVRPFKDESIPKIPTFPHDDNKFAKLIIIEHVPCFGYTVCQGGETISLQRWVNLAVDTYVNNQGTLENSVYGRVLNMVAYATGHGETRDSGWDVVGRGQNTRVSPPTKELDLGSNVAAPYWFPLLGVASQGWAKTIREVVN